MGRSWTQRRGRMHAGQHQAGCNLLRAPGQLMSLGRARTHGSAICARRGWGRRSADTPALASALPPPMERGGGAPMRSAASAWLDGGGGGVSGWGGGASGVTGEGRCKKLRGRGEPLVALGSPWSGVKGRWVLYRGGDSQGADIERQMGDWRARGWGMGDAVGGGGRWR